MTTRIQIPSFDTTVVFMHDVDRNAVRRYLKKQHNIRICDVDGDYAGITFDLDGMTWLVYVPDTNMGLVQLVRTLSHEANHVTLQMMQKIGVEDDETICYVQDNLLGQLLKKVVKEEKVG